MDIFEWLNSLQMDDNHQRFLNLICGWDGGVQTFTKMPAIGWEKFYANWIKGNVKPDNLIDSWDCLPK